MAFVGKLAAVDAKGGNVAYAARLPAETDITPRGTRHPAGGVTPSRRRGAGHIPKGA
jgi:hypothetical protein